MAGNTRALSEQELKYIKDTYTFEIKDEYVVVSTKGFNRKTLHDVNKSFFISSKLRKINISKSAIDLWIKNFESEYSLIEVQNAINTLIVTYQDISVEDILVQMDNMRVKVEHLNEEN